MDTSTGGLICAHSISITNAIDLYLCSLHPFSNLEEKFVIRNLSEIRTLNSRMSLLRQLEELVLLRCSLLPGELLEFILSDSEDLETWTKIVNACSEGDVVPQASTCIPCPAHFTMKIRDAPLWFEIEFPKDYPLEISEPHIIVRGHNISRADQQRWQDIVREKFPQSSQVDFPTYELVSSHLLPLLHAEYDAPAAPATSAAVPEVSSYETLHHALLTSHHLKSPQKRRSLQQWSSELQLCGFAKVGHPGVIYCSGSETNVEEFVSRVKDMQWLALRVRFIESVPVDRAGISTDKKKRGTWLEVEKVGEVVEEMRKLGRESYVLDLGIGSGGTT